VSTAVVTVSVGVDVVRVGEYRLSVYPVEPAVVAPPVRDVAPEAVHVCVSPDPVIVLTPPEKAAPGASYAVAVLAPANTSASAREPASNDLPTVCDKDACLLMDAGCRSGGRQQ